MGAPRSCDWKLRSCHLEVIGFAKVDRQQGLDPGVGTAWLTARSGQRAASPSPTRRVPSRPCGSPAISAANGNSSGSSTATSPIRAPTCGCSPNSDRSSTSPVSTRRPRRRSCARAIRAASWPSPKPICSQLLRTRTNSGCRSTPPIPRGGSSTNGLNAKRWPLPAFRCPGSGPSRASTTGPGAARSPAPFTTRQS